MYTTIEPATTEQVWMSVLRRGLAFHLLDDRKTICGTKYVRDGRDSEPLRGHLLADEDAIRLGAHACRRCYDGHTDRQQPQVRGQEWRAAQ